LHHLAHACTIVTSPWMFASQARVGIKGKASAV